MSYGACRTCGIDSLARCVEDAAIAVHEVAAGRLALAIRHAVRTGAIDVHDVLLIAGAVVAGTLKDEALAIGAEIGFCILPTVGQLANIAEVLLLPRIRGDRSWHEWTLS